MAKPTGKNATYFREKEIEEKLRDLLKTTTDGRVKYPSGVDDLSVAQEMSVGKGAIVRMRGLCFPDMELVPQHFRTVRKQREPKPPKAKPFVYPGAGKLDEQKALQSDVNWLMTELSDLRKKIALVTSDFDLYKDDQETKYRALWNLIDQRTMPDAAVSLTQVFENQIAAALDGNVR